jgi:hypothetical protein
MKISRKYEQALENYLRWARCTTPEDCTIYGQRLRAPGTAVSEGVSAAEALLAFESFGKTIPCREPELLAEYRRGKANRDWWTKEKGWWDKHACYVDEEFSCHITPEPFYELFGHWPRSPLVRYWFDNNYTNEEFDQDQKLFYRGIERGQDGLEIIYDLGR